MKTSEMINKAKDRCTDENGILDKTKFYVFVGVMFHSESDENRKSEELISAYNKGIRCVLGSGHSLASCLQFFNGKKAKPYVDRIMNAAEAKIKEISLS